MTEAMLLQIVGELPLFAFLLYAWVQERKERIKTQEILLSVLMTTGREDPKARE